MAVEDNGIGIAPEAIGNIFDSLYTTKDDGTGIGLAVCQSIADRNVARFEVVLKVGIGTTFIVKFKAHNIPSLLPLADN